MRFLASLGAVALVVGVVITTAPSPDARPYEHYRHREPEELLP